MVNLFGNGFIGSHYVKKYGAVCNDRNNLVPSGEKDILYLISTIHNYNVLNNPYIDIETNLTTLIRVLEHCKDKDIVFNFVSSWFVYGDTDYPANENSYCNPKGFYSITKRTAEQLLISYCETFNIKYRIIRIANVLGPDDSKTSKKKNALTYLINQIKNNEDISLYDGGNLTRDYIHVSDVCDAINLILEKGVYNTIYNVGNGQPTIFKDAIEYVIQKTNSKSKITNIVQPEFHKNVQVKSMYMDCSKLKSLGYKPQYGINDMLDELIKS
jgi:nucleoside-diphosphate-sugar epimerase